MSQLEFFQDLGVDCLTRLSAGVHLFQAERGELLLGKGCCGHDLYVLVGGQARISLSQSDGEGRVLALLSRGECFGEASALLGMGCPGFVTAISPCHLLAIDHTVLILALRQNPSLATRLMMVLATRLHHLMQDLEMSGHRQGVQRLASFLLRQRPQVGMPDNRIVLPGRKRDIAGKLGMAPETFSRSLRQLVNQGLIKETGAQIDLLDPSGLAALSKPAPEPAPVAPRNNEQHPQPATNRMT